MSNYLGMAMNTANDFSGLYGGDQFQKPVSQGQLAGGLLGGAAGMALAGPAGAALGNSFGRMIGGMIGQKKAGQMQKKALGQQRARTELFRSFYQPR